jgi:hypothetical protein
VSGFDLTFSAPKSVSVLWGLGDSETSAAVRAAHDRAVTEGLSYLERRATVARRGHNGERRIETSGLVAAAFVHRTSRNGDPQLHTHVLAANVVLSADGRWSSPEPASSTSMPAQRASSTRPRCGPTWSNPSVFVSGPSSGVRPNSSEQIRPSYAASPPAGPRSRRTSRCGASPASVNQQRRYDRVARNIDAYRERFDVDGPDPLGPRPFESFPRLAYDHVDAQIRDYEMVRWRELTQPSPGIETRDLGGQEIARIDMGLEP